MMPYMRHANEYEDESDDFRRVPVPERDREAPIDRQSAALVIGTKLIREACNGIDSEGGGGFGTGTD